MKILAAVATEQKIPFVIVEVKMGVLTSSIQKTTILKMLRKAFLDREIVLMAKHVSGRPKFFGREDIAQFLAGVQMSRYSWKEYDI